MNSDLENIVNDLQKRVALLEKAVYNSSYTLPQGFEQLLAEKVDEIGTQELILLALRRKPQQTKNQIKAMLSDLGKAYGSWFEGGNFSGRLVRKGLVKKDGTGEQGDLYSLTKKGEIEADNMLAKLPL